MVDEIRETIYRLSYVKMYYSTVEGGQTPTPFAEVRAFLFTKMRPTRIGEEMIKKRLRDAIEKMMPLFFTLTEAEAMGKAYYETKQELSEMAVTKKEGEIKVEIDGFEVADVDVDEVLEFFKGKRVKITYDDVFRYVRFDYDTRPSKEYDEYEIRYLQSLKPTEEEGE